MRQALRREVTVNKTLVDMSGSLVSKASVADISQQVLDSAKALTSSEFGYVGHIDPATGNLVTSTMTRDIWDSCRVSGKSVIFETFSGLWGWVLKNRQPLLTNTPTTDPRSSGTPEGHLPVHRFLSAPALIGGKLLGQIALANKFEDYTDSDLEVVQRLADFYAIALQRKHFEDTLQRTANEWKNTFDAMPDGVLLVANDFSVIRANNAALRLLRKSPGDIYKHPCYQLIHDADCPAPFCPHTRTIADGQEHECKFYETHLKKFFRVTTTPFFSENQDIIGSVHIMRDITERKRTEERLARLQAAVDISADALFIIDPEKMRILDVNKTACKSLEYSREDLQRRGPQDIKPRYSKSKLKAIFTEVLAATSQTGNIETVHQRRDGTQFPVEILLRPLVHKNQRLVVAAARDLTERHLVEDALRESMQTSEDLVTAIPSGIFIYQFQSPDKLILYNYNPAAEQLLGEQIKHQTGCDFTDIWRQKKATALKQKLLTVVASEKPLTIENFFFQDGTISYNLRLHAFTMPWERLALVVEDVTEHNRLATIVETIWAGILQFDHKNRMVYCNRQFRNMFRVDRTTLCGQNLSNYLPQEQAETVKKKIAAMAAGRKFTMTAQRFLMDSRYFEYSAVVLQDELGNYNGALFFFRDITQDMQEQQQLIEHEKQLSLEVMVAGIAHDLNNPLSGLQGCLRRIRKNPENLKQTQEYLDLMKEALDNMEQVIHQMIQFSGREFFRFEPVNLTEVLRQAIRFTAKSVDQPQVNLSLQTEPDNIWIDGDAASLFNAFLNLLLNAYDALSGRGAIAVDSTFGKEEQTIVVEIKDNGPGIPPELQSRIFDPYFTTKSSGRGTGLGLSITRQTISRHGGTLKIDSQPGQGTTVRLLLPRLPDATKIQ